MQAVPNDYRLIPRASDILFDDSVPMNEVNPRLIRAKLNFAEVSFVLPAR